MQSISHGQPAMAIIRFPSGTNQQQFMAEVDERWPHLNDVVKEDGDFVRVPSTTLWDDYPDIKDAALNLGGYIEDYR